MLASVCYVDVCGDNKLLFGGHVDKSCAMFDFQVWIHNEVGVSFCFVNFCIWLDFSDAEFVARLQAAAGFCSFEEIG